MSPFPPQVRDVPRPDVFLVVRDMLSETDSQGRFLVGSVECKEQPDGLYTIIPRRRRHDLDSPV